MSDPGSDLAGRSFSRILLVKPSSLGDVVHALPVLRGLRRRYPEARIDWMISSALAPLLEGHPALDGLIQFDRRRFGRLALSPRIAREFVRFIRSLRARDYDLVIDLQGLFRSGFLAWTTGAKVRVGFLKAREGASLFYTHTIEHHDLDAHAVDRNYGVAKLLGFEDVPIRFDLPVHPSAAQSAEQLFAGQPRTVGKSIVAVAPGARWATKRWSPERFAETIERIETSGESCCILLGGPDERALCDRIARRCRREPINWAGQTSLPILVAVLDRTNVVVCHDSAIAHLAVALEKPLVCLIGPTSPARTGPYRRMQDVVRLDLDCAPCYLRKLSRCRHAHRCMNELTVSQVIGAVDSRLVPPVMAAL